MAPQHEEMLTLWTLSMTVQNLSQKTIRERVVSVRAFLRAADVEDLSAVKKLDLLTFLSNPAWAPGTRATYRSELATFFRWCVDEGHLEHDPTARLPRVRVRAAEPNPIETDLMQQLLDSGIRGHTITKVLLYAYEGLRASEIAGIHGEHVDWIRERLWIANAKGDRPVWRPLSSLVLEHVKERGYPMHGPWFPSYRLDGPITGRSVSDTISKAMKRAGIAHRPHDLRKWHGTTLLEQDADSIDVQHSLRHVDGQSMKAYVRPNERRIRAAKERLPRVEIPARPRLRDAG